MIRVVWHQGATAFPSGELHGWYATEAAAWAAGAQWKSDAERAERGGMFRFELRTYEERFTDAPPALDNSNYTQTIRVAGYEGEGRRRPWRHVAIRPEYLAQQESRYSYAGHYCCARSAWPAHAERVGVRPATRRTSTGQDGQAPVDSGDKRRGRSSPTEQDS